MAYYLDTSAVVKLVVSENESAALRSWCTDKVLVASDLVRTETLRAARRHSPDALAQARRVLTALVMLGLTAEACERAAELDPMILRSLDALHLACALQLADELEGVVTYDERLGEACVLLGVPVVAPVASPARRSRRGT